MNENRISGSQIAGIIGLIASCITILVFVTGWNNIRDIFRNSPPTPTYLKPVTTMTEDSPIPTIIRDTATKTSTPSVTQLIESKQNYKIEQICNGSTGIDLYVQAPDFPYRSASIFFFKSVVRDIAGNWAFGGKGGGVGNSFSSQGIASVDVISGDYAITESYNLYEVNILGYWGNATISENNTGIVLIAPVRDGCRTKVTMIVGKLEIGVLNTNGDKALKGIHVSVYCQINDIAGNKASDPACNTSNSGVESEATNSSGLATFFLGPGRYYIRYYEYLNQAGYKYLYDINVSPNETNRIIINYP